MAQRRNFGQACAANTIQAAVVSGQLSQVTSVDLNPVDNYLHGSWEALGSGAPMLVALAQLCSQRWVLQSSSTVDLQGLPDEALAILYAARHRGIIEIRAVNSAFDPAARLLAVYVEVAPEQVIVFRDKDNPEVTVRFLEGFRQLCDRGLIMHHIFGDFCVAPRGLELARSIADASVVALLDKATDFGLHD